MLLKGEKYYNLFILNFFYFRLYIINIFKSLTVYIKIKINYILARKLILLIILISTQLINAILYNKYNNKYIAVIED